MRTRNTLFPAAIVAALTIASLAGCSGTASESDSTPSASATQAASEKLPSDFPKSDVPLVDGQVVVARGDKDNGWSVTVQPKNNSGFADAKSALEKAGYTQQAGGTETKVIYTSDKYTVAVGTPGVSVTYTVTAN